MMEGIVSTFQHQVILELGSNIGDRKTNLRKGLSLLIQNSPIRVLRVSSIYASSPVGCGGGEFFNAVAFIYTGLTPELLLSEAKKCEKMLGRTGGSQDPRPLDIDIIYFDDLVINNQDLKIPHPRRFERSFVIVPLVEVASDWIDPEQKRSVSVIVASRIVNAKRALRFIEGPQWFTE